jgi:hypothetical protein
MSFTIIDDWFHVVPDKTKCKHGTKDCDICGTSNRRDTKHKTENGRGAVGRLIDKKRRR